MAQKSPSPFDTEGADVDFERIRKQIAICRICGDPTKSTGTCLCDRCWELERRIKMDPVIARKILEAIYEGTV